MLSDSFVGVGILFFVGTSCSTAIGTVESVSTGEAEGVISSTRYHVVGLFSWLVSISWAAGGFVRSVCVLGDDGSMIISSGFQLFPMMSSPSSSVLTTDELFRHFFV